MIIYAPKHLQKIAKENPITERALANIMHKAHCAAIEGYFGVSDYWNDSVDKINSKAQREYIKSVLITMGYTDVKIKKYSFTISWEER
jgi:hypothetical protein